ncbi:MAG: LPS export ABC transporter permease LptG [Gammaproteobacteria bacterium]|nr:LPS export ABC transporter permease LptG [Gammaproteobacteria bacterium]MCP5200733.1 LPS export ABC transporter permease LptG [Gammaproteobacteria bacterium]
MASMKIVDRYIGRNVIGATLTVLVVLLAIFTFFAFIDELEDIGRGTYTLTLAAAYVGLSLPGLVYQLFPIAALIGALIGLGSLVERNEIAVVRCAGVSKLRVIAAVMKAGAIFVIAAVLIGELVFPPAEQHARVLRGDALEKTVARLGGEGFWARDGNSYINIREVLPGHRFRDVQIFEFDDDQHLVAATVAASAEYVDGQWLLHDIGQTRFVDGGPRAVDLDEARWDSTLDPALIGMTALKPDTLATTDLLRYVEFAHRNGQNAQTWEYALWGKLAYPLATAVMVYLAIPLVLRASRGVTMGRRILVGAVIGLGFHIVNQAAAHLGVVFGVPAAWSALLPTAVLFVCGTVLNHRTP